jgi:hypothetical protein
MHRQCTPKDSSDDCFCLNAAACHKTLWNTEKVPWSLMHQVQTASWYGHVYIWPSHICPVQPEKAFREELPSSSCPIPLRLSAPWWIYCRGSSCDDCHLMSLMGSAACLWSEKSYSLENWFLVSWIRVCTTLPICFTLKFEVVVCLWK